MINPFQAMQMLQNPKALLSQQLQAKMQQMAQANPEVYKRALEMTSGKTEAELKQTALNIANEKGIDINKFASQFGIKL